MATKSQAAVATVSAVVLAAGAMGAVVPAVTAAQAPLAGVEAAVAGAGSALTTAQANGNFTFTQDTLTANSELASTFQAAASECASMPAYGLSLSEKIAIGGDAAHEYLLATVEDLTKAAGSAALVLACACASNLAGASAIANADVEGLSLAELAKLAGVR